MFFLSAHSVFAWFGRNNIFCLSVFIWFNQDWIFIFLPLVRGCFEHNCVKQEERKRCGWICNCESSCKYLTPPLNGVFAPFTIMKILPLSRLSDLVHICLSFTGLKTSPADTCRRHYSPGTVPVTQVNVCCNTAAAVLTGISGSKDIIRFIVPQCLRPQASNCEAILYYCDFLTLIRGFPSINRSTVHFPISSLAPGVGSVTICLCPCLHVFFIDMLHHSSYISQAVLESLLLFGPSIDCCLYCRVCFQEMAVKNESGLSENLLKISWLEGQPEDIASQSHPGQFTSAQVEAKPQIEFSPLLPSHINAQHKY